MRHRVLLFCLTVLLSVASGACRPDAEPPAATTAGETAAPGDAATAPASAPSAGAAGEPSTAPASTPAPSAAPAASGGAAPATAALASQETNWQGVVAEITEFRRKGNTLTVRLRLRNQATEPIQTEMRWDETYLMDAAGGKKYQVLQDETGSHIASLNPGWKERWYDKVPPGQSFTVWAKFPAPPAEVKTMTLQIPGVPPFEDLPIQDS